MCFHNRPYNRPYSRPYTVPTPSLQSLQKPKDYASSPPGDGRGARAFVPVSWRAPGRQSCTQRVARKRGRWVHTCTGAAYAYMSTAYHAAHAHQGNAPTGPLLNRTPHVWQAVVEYVPASSQINVHSVMRAEPSARPALPSHCNVVHTAATLAKRKCSFTSQRWTCPCGRGDLADQLCKEGGSA